MGIPMGIKKKKRSLGNEFIQKLMKTKMVGGSNICQEAEKEI